MSELYISNQIAVYKNSKTLVEFQDKLKPASLECYAHLHADGEATAEGPKRHSLIGILMKDYSNGTGDKAVTVTANISPEEAKFILSRLTGQLKMAGAMNGDCHGILRWKTEKVFR